MDLESKRREYEILENDLKATQSSYKTTKFSFIEKLSKESCFDYLLNNTSIASLNLELNRSNLKTITAQNKQIKEDIQKQCEEYILIQDVIKHNLEVLQKEKEENNRLEMELQKLKDEEYEYKEREKESDTVVRNLALIEDRINEIEKVGLVSEDELDQLVNEISEKSLRVRNYRNELEENTVNIGIQERYMLYKKGLDFVAGITGISVLDCVAIASGFKVFLKYNNLKSWVFVVSNKLDNIVVVENDDSIGDLRDAIKYAIKQNNLMYLIKKIISE